MRFVTLVQQQVSHFKRAVYDKVLQQQESNLGRAFFFYVRSPAVDSHSNDATLHGDDNGTVCEVGEVKFQTLTLIGDEFIMTHVG